MAINEKILRGLKSVTTHLENSMLALNKKDEDSFAGSLWHVAAELEYTLFLFSIAFQNERDLSKWKPNPEPKIETVSMLINVQNLLNEAEKFVVNAKLLDAYKNAYIARHYILKVQEDLAKKKRQMLKKKQ
jgi:hypothetical protein